MKLIITRHGETTDNFKKIIQGRLPGLLSEKGIKQAEELSTRLSKHNIDIIYSSDLKRSVDTAKIINKKVNSRIIYREELREIYMGDYEGKKRPWKNETEMKEFIENNEMNGETLADLYERAKKFLRELKNKHPRETILLVGHTAINQALISAIKEQGAEQIFNQEKQKNTAVNVFQINGKGYEIEKLNCTSHIN